MKMRVMNAGYGLILVLSLLAVLATCANPSGGDNTPAPVTALSLDDLVTAPVKGAEPDTRAIDTDQYTGTVAWQTASGAAHNGAFVPSTVYRALVTFIAKSGYTFDGVAANSFSYTGAAAVANAVDSGTVTITFPETGPEPETSNTDISIGNPSVVLYKDGSPLSHGGSTTVARGEGIFTVSIAPGGYTEITWRLNGNLQTRAQDKTSIVLSKQTPGLYLVTVEATPMGGVKNSGSHTFVAQ